MTSAPVVVVGAGPTGLTAALLLARYGIAVVVLERRPTVWRQPRAVHLDDEAVRVLQEAGVAAGFAAISRAGSGLRLLDARLRPFAVFRRETGPGVHGHPAANLFDQPDLDALLRAAAHERSIVVRDGTEVTGLRPQPDGTALVDLRDAEGSPQTLAAAAVLGCDGATSTVRACLEIGLRDLGLTQRWMVLDIACRHGLGDWGGVDQVCDPRRPATFLRLAGDRYRFEFRLHPDESAAQLLRTGRAAALTAPWLADAPDHEVLRCAEYTFRARIAERWRAGRVFLLGDAAHLMPPFVGQGLGAGLRDAHNLAWKLADVLHGRADERLLATYQAERAPHAEATIRTAVRVGHAMTGGNDALAAVRRPVVAGLLRLPGAERRALAATVTRFPAGPTVAHRRHRQDLPGTRCPQPTVTRFGRPVLLDDVLGPGWTLLCRSRASPALCAMARQHDARVVALDESISTDLVIGDADHLAAWLRTGRATAALLRPDRIVAAVDPSRPRSRRRPGPS